MVKSVKTVVSSLVSKEEVQRAEIDDLVEKRFEGSLPAFIASFASGRGLSEKEVDEIRRIIGK